jgi:hypothetical protein
MGVTSTDYGVSLTAPDGTSAVLTINVNHLNPLPGSDTWKGDPSIFGVSGGAVSSWNTGDALLSGPVGAASIRLTGFSKQTNVNDHNSGTKNYDDGSFPMDTFTWTCTSKD